MAEIYFDVDAALSEVPVNIFPLTDDTDFKTRETGITYDQAGMDLVWNFVTTAGAYTQTAVTPTTGGNYDWTHQGDGMYSIEIPASGGASINNDTEGFGWFTGICTGVLPWRSPVFGFRAAGINDKLIDSVYDTTRGLAGTALPAAAADAAGGLPISDAGGLDLDTLLSTLTNATYGLAAIETLVDDLESRLTATRAGYLDNLASAPPTAAAIADAVCDEALSGHQAPGTVGISLTDTLGYVTALRAAITDLRAGYLDNLSAGAVALASGVIVTTNNDKTGYSLSVTPPTSAQIADAVWDEVLTGVTHNVATSAGRRLRDITSNVIITGTSPNTGGTANTYSCIELDSDASAVDGAYDPSIICITGGTGAGQSRQVWEYNGTTKCAYINRDWKVIPDNTSVYAIFAWSGDTHINEGICGTCTNNTITLNSLASSVNDSYKDQVVFITSGTGQDQARKITGYNGTTKVATVDTNWNTNPVAGSIYTILPYYNTASAGGDATAANQTTILNHLTDIKGATFSGSTDSLEAIRDRGDIAWITGAGLSGSNTVTLTIQDGSSNNIVGAFVEAWDSAGTSFLERKISNASGQVVYSMDDGTYTIKIIKSGYSFTPEQIVISGNTSHTYDMTPYVITPPATGDLCRVYTYIFKPDGTKYASCTSTAVIYLYDNNNNQYYAGTISGIYSAVTGLVYFDLIQGAQSQITINEVSFSKTVTVPAETTKELDEL